MKISDLTDFVGITNTTKSKPVEPEQSGVDRENLGHKEVFVSWSAEPNLSLTKLDPRYNRTFIIIAAVLGILLFAMQEYFIILVVASLAFLYQILSKNLQVGEMTYEVSSHGISIEDHFYYWDEVVRFFFSRRYGNSEMLIVDLKTGMPARLLITFLPEDKGRLIEAINKYARYVETEPVSSLDKMYSSVLDKFDFEQKKE